MTHDKIDRLLGEATRQIIAYAAAGGDLYLGGSRFPTYAVEAVAIREPKEPWPHGEHHGTHVE